MKNYIFAIIMLAATSCVTFGQDTDALLKSEESGGVTELLNEIKARDKIIADRDQAIVKLKASFAEINEAFSKKVAELQSVTRSDALDAALDKKKKALRERDIALKARDDALAQRDEAQKKYDELVLSSNEKTRVLEESLSENQDSILKMKSAITLKDSKIARLQTQVESSEDSTQKERLALTYNLGCIYKAAKKYKKAEEAFLKALEINPNDSSANYNLGILYDDNLNEPEKAKQYYARFIELAPKDKDVPRVREWIKEL